MTLAFADELAYFADTTGWPHLTPIIDRLRRPVRVAVSGRPGVGRGHVAAALRQRGLAVLPPGANVAAAEVDLLVIAETVKPEDFVRTTRRPAVIVLTKADLSGPGVGGPMVVARRRAAAITRETGTPTVPMIGLLATLGGADAVPDALEDEFVDALRAFVTEPADLTGVDAFVDGPHVVGRDLRARVLERLDRFGIAHGVLALADGCDPADLTAHLRRLGNLDEVMSAIDVAAAPARYLRICTAVSELYCLAVQLNDDRVSELASADNAVMAAMTAAVEVVEAAGVVVDRRDTRAAHIGRAVHWSRYGRGPVNAVHRRCGEDIARGSLRLVAERWT